MRRTIREQPALMPGWADDKHARELAEISRLLAEHPELTGLVYLDLVQGGRNVSTGRLPKPLPVNLKSFHC